MNGKGQVQIYALMLGLVVIILGLALAPAVKQSTDSARNATDGDTIGMDCSNESISNFDKATCMATDLSLFYWVGGIIMIGGIIVGAKLIFDVI